MGTKHGGHNPAFHRLFTNPSGTRSVGGQKKKWGNLVNQDARELGYYT